MTKLKNALGTYELHFEDGKKGLIFIKNQAQARFLTDNMTRLRIKEWRAIEN